MKVIKKGNKYRVVCDVCGALLEYTERDVDEYSIVTCPECHNSIPHNRENRYEG